MAKEASEGVATSQLELKSTQYEVSIGAKVPGKVPFSIATADVKTYIDIGDDFDAKLDDLKEKLSEAVSAALLVCEDLSARQ